MSNESIFIAGVNGLFLGRFGQDPARWPQLSLRSTASPAPTGGPAMTIGISTYAFFWQWHATAEQPLSLAEMITKTHRLGSRAVPDLRLPADRVL